MALNSSAMGLNSALVSAAIHSSKRGPAILSLLEYSAYLACSAANDLDKSVAPALSS